MKRVFFIFCLISFSCSLIAQSNKNGLPAPKPSADSTIWGDDFMADIRDTDKDGVPDAEDLCPALAGLKENKGCPGAAKPNSAPNSVYCSYIQAMRTASEDNFMSVIDLNRPLVNGPGNTNHNYHSSLSLAGYSVTLIGFNGGDPSIRYKDAPYCFTTCTKNFGSRSEAQNEFNKMVRELGACMEISYAAYHDQNDCADCDHTRAYFKIRKLKDLNGHGYDLECRFFLRNQAGAYRIEFEVLKPVGGSNFTNASSRNDQEILETGLAMEFFRITAQAADVNGSYTKYKKGEPVKLTSEHVYDITDQLALAKLIKASLYVATRPEGTSGIVAEIPSSITASYIAALKTMVTSAGSNEVIGEVITTRENGFTRYKYRSKILDVTLMVIMDYDDIDKNDNLAFLSIY